MIVRISALQEGFRRCGIAHSVQPVDHPVERFSEAELARLLDEPLLKVQLLAEHSLASFCAQLVDEQPLANLPDDAYPAGAAAIAVGLLADEGKPVEVAGAVEAAAVAEAPAASAPAVKPNAKDGAKSPAKAGK